ncbi:MAG: histidine phosphatase family protein [Candidatus Nealsonbacteria bacterium]|nr:histidine phosphatase family protein [Candidatus Nealsonbacteria bacterium]
MSTLILLRHFQSQWNLENRFTGWVDVPLSREGIRQVEKVAQKLSEIKINAIYTSPLIRNQDTILRIFEHLVEKYPIFIHFEGKMKKWGNFHEINKDYFPVYVSERLNERYYGDLQGLNKDMMIKKYGPEKVHLWRRGFDVKPPKGESLKETLARTMPLYTQYIEKDLKKGKTILVVASHNSLRSLVKHIEKIPDQGISKIEMLPGTITKYEFDTNLKLKNKEIL